MKLPQEFLHRMEQMLAEEFPGFIACYEKPLFRGLRLNTLKCDQKTLLKSTGFPLRESPFAKKAFYLDTDIRVGRMPAFHAGMFYAQEPSAASAVTLLQVRPHDRVLDLCAAPGGKSTQIAAALGGTGLLWANEIVGSRAQALQSNIERMGVRNAVVSSEHPQRLCEGLRGFFDKVLVDAPCSGEGMFRKEPEALLYWRPDYPAQCAARQGEILQSAALALRENGELVYSTCTFSPEENEETVKWFLKENPDFELCACTADFGRPGIDGIGVRIYPMDGGEGHFAVKLRRKSANSCDILPPAPQKETAEITEAKRMYAELFSDEPAGYWSLSGGRIYLLPERMPQVSGLHLLRAGLLFGQLKGKRIEPEHSVFMAHSGAACRHCLDFLADASMLPAFLHGEEIDSPEKGYTAVCVNSVVTGFGKSSGGRLKNKYPKGLRI